MDFERVKNEEQRKIRVKQIKDAAIKIFDKRKYLDITLAEIAKETNFTRGNLYKYVSSKEEIYLLVIADEFAQLVGDLQVKICKKFSKEVENFANILALTISEHERFLKLYSILYAFLEKNVSEEKLIEFKESFSEVMSEFVKVVQTAFPELNSKEIRKFIEILGCFVIGFYPLSNPDSIQKNAFIKSSTGYYPSNFVETLKEQIIFNLKNVTYSENKIFSIPYRLV
ncbi:TetR/AcrR family transcriptional regulator [Fusobacterium sp. IOR10]|uniref:TetR/AcrR family transcriptional regulator n=1 Tax=Fusobacterium sp. IOR10 TaxID=2665157 RepID=UPI0013D476F1|nr:TetR/AcrR family transcriptional regulator [Fusobacterium sp. IOR10]